jgi:hypothetical protein
MLSLIIMMAVTSVQAQSAGKIAVTIPFEFQIGSQVLPAGQYIVKRLSQNSVLVRREDGRESAIAMTPRSVQAGVNEKPSQEKLVFRMYGDKYFLSQVWMVSGGDGRELDKTDAERDAAKALNLAGGDGARARKVVVAARAH